jgi:Rod binding domain-containing protein
MNISALQSQAAVKSADVPLDKLASNPNLSEPQKAAEACRQFEAVLLRQILGDARKTVISSSISGAKSTTAGIYQDMVNNQLADSISKSGAFGLAKNLQAQLVHQVLRPGDAAKTVPTPLGAQPVNVSKKQ